MEIPLKPDSEDYRRLLNMLGGDKGYFILALHGFIEAYCKACIGCPDDYPGGFKGLLDDFAGQLSRRGTSMKGFGNVRSCLLHERKLTNEVRHQFAPADSEQVRSAIQTFRSFCRIAGLQSSHLDTLKKQQEIWDEERSLIETRQALKDTRWNLFQAQKEIKRVLEQYHELETRQDEFHQVQRHLISVNEQLADIQGRYNTNKDRITELRREKHRLAGELRDRSERLAELEDVADYVENLQSSTYYTRTRLDYERSVIRLTPEQNDVVGRMREDHDFLVKGAAGTGKTLILLETMKRFLAHRAANPLLDGGEGRPVALVTYTRTLERYNHYLSSLMELGNLDIRTEDSLILKVFRERFPGFRIDFKADKVFAKAHAGAGGLGAAELALELETFLLGGVVTEKEYCQDRIPRTGLKQRLGAEARRELWRLRERYIGEQRENRTLSPKNARLMMLEHLRSRSVQSSQADAVYDHIFLDECQDLTPLDLMVLKELTTKSLLMAGDSDQTLYGFSSPYARAGLTLSGYSRTVKTNFRNTLPIHRLAEKIRLGSDYSDTESCPAAFRNGPEPQIIRSVDTDKLYELLIGSLRILVGALGCDMENIAVLMPGNNLIRKMARTLQDAGFPSADIRDDSFSFTHTPGVRLSTIHSAKGLDFPVVLAFLPTLFGGESLDRQTAEKQRRNTLYVALTRAMENLMVFVKDGAEGVLGEL